jgi:hypothetical protein
MVTLWGTSDVSGVSGDDERESMAAAVVGDIGDEVSTNDELNDARHAGESSAKTDPSHPGAPLT